MLKPQGETTLRQRPRGKAHSGMPYYSTPFGNFTPDNHQTIWFFTEAGELGTLQRPSSAGTAKKCRGIHVEAVDSLCDSATNRYVLKATVFPSKASAGFVGYGDADPSNVSPLVRGAEMRIAETRAVNRALRKAYGIGICSVDEIGSGPSPLGRFRTSIRSRQRILVVMATVPVMRSATSSAKSSASTNSIPNW